MPTNDKPQQHRLKNANASTLAKLLRMNAIERLKRASAREKAAAIAKPVRKRIRGSVFDDDGTDA